MWEKPEVIIEYEANTMPEWVRLFDPSHKHIISSIILPTNRLGNATCIFYPRNKSADFLKHIAVNPRVKAAMTIQSAYRNKRARERLRIQRAKSDLLAVIMGGSQNLTPGQAKRTITM